MPTIGHLVIHVRDFGLLICVLFDFLVIDLQLTVHKNLKQSHLLFLTVTVPLMWLKCKLVSDRLSWLSNDKNAVKNSSGYSVPCCAWKTLRQPRPADKSITLPCWSQWHVVNSLGFNFGHDDPSQQLCKCVVLHHDCLNWKSGLLPQLQAHSYLKPLFINF